MQMEQLTGLDEEDQIIQSAVTRTPETVPRQPLRLVELLKSPVSVAHPMSIITAHPSLAPTPTEHVVPEVDEVNTGTTHSISGQTVFESPGEDDGSSISPPEEAVSRIIEPD